VLGLVWDGNALGVLEVADPSPGKIGEDGLGFLRLVRDRLVQVIRRYWERRDLLSTQEAYDELQRRGDSMMAMGEMASQLAHEVKNPMASIMLTASRLRKHVSGNEQAGPLAEKLCRSIAMLGEIVTSVTDSLGRPALDLRPVDMGAVLDDAVALVAPRAEKQNVLVRWDTSESLPPVSGDAAYLTRALLNILVNALDVMPDGGVLGLYTRLAEDNAVEVAVWDTGPGIDPDKVDELFKPFRTTKPEGTGLGLMIVRRIVELHGGTVTLKRLPEGGTEVLVRIPAGTGR
jgi:signal transduction histidine kinase